MKPLDPIYLHQINIHKIRMLNFTCSPFAELSVYDLYEIMALRQEVFVVEQDCVFQDADGLDQKGWHLMAKDAAGKLIAYARLLPPGISYDDYPSIGRIVSSPSVRGTGAGRALVQRGIEEVYRLFGKQDIKIGAQTYLLKFYQSFDFQPVGEEYLEDGIPHIAMVKVSDDAEN